MKKILLITSAISLLATTGCLVADGPYHEHRYRHEEYRHEEIEGPRRVIVEPPPPVVVRPEIIIH